MSSLFERIGGEAAMMAAVDGFYRRVTADPLLAPFFAALDMQAQTKKQLAFMTWALGGPSEYRGRPLGDAHRHMVRERGLSDRHFDAVAAHLAATLQELAVPAPLIDEAMGIVASTRQSVLGPAAPPEDPKHPLGAVGVLRGHGPSPPAGSAARDLGATACQRAIAPPPTPSRAPGQAGSSPSC
jgi:hemoglobin